MAAIWDWYDDYYFFFFPVPTVLRCFCGSMLPETASSATTTTGCSLSTIWMNVLPTFMGSSSPFSSKNTMRLFRFLVSLQSRAQLPRMYLPFWKISATP